MKLILDDNKTSIAEMAHIEPHSEGGGVSAENLILLCRNCHRLYEPVDHPEKKQKLRQWKADRIQLIRKTLSVQFTTFEELSAQVRPLLVENYQIFTEYGPHTDDPETFNLWQKFEPKLITNNAKLKLLFLNNINLFSSSGRDNNQKAIHYFIHHVDEFYETRNGFNGVRKSLFPRRILSIFGIEEEPFSEEPSINAIQNLIRALQAKGCHVRFVLADHDFPRLIIDRDGEIETLRLNNNPRVEQLIFSEEAREPHSTDMRLDNLQFTLRRVADAGVRWSFDDLTDLTILTINDRLKVKLFYSYCLSTADLQSGNLSAISHVANLHNWNGAPSTGDAYVYAESIGVEIMTFNEFIQFCRDNAL